MRTRVTVLLMLIVLATAPVALANHCKVCRPLLQTCQTSLNNGWVNCEFDESQNKCITSLSCGNHLTTPDVDAFASEFEVASVERLDALQSTNDTTETRVASLETAPAATR